MGPDDDEEHGTIEEEAFDGTDLLPLDAYDFPDDGYNYAQHLKPMGGGTFIAAVEDPSGDLFGRPPVLEDIEARYIMGGSESVLPPDVLELLEGDFEEGDLQDDFLAIADAEASDEYDYSDDDLPPPLEYERAFQRQRGANKPGQTFRRRGGGLHSSGRVRKGEEGQAKEVDIREQDQDLR
jgi:hypothetical protein